MKTVLFISHDASRTGAPIVLLNLLKWLKANTELSFQVLLRRSGELQSEFEAIAPTYLFDPGSSARPAWARLWQRLRPAQDQRLARLRTHCRQANVGLIYANTIVSSDIVAGLADLGYPTICHVHELEFLIRHYLGLAEFARLKQAVHHYIAVSDAVQENLMVNHQIPATQIERIYEFIPTAVHQLDQYQDQRQAVRQQLGIPLEAAIVCASGTIEWRKGPDLFLHLARQVQHQKPGLPVYFLWVGGETNSPRYHELMHDVELLGLGSTVRFLGAQPQAAPYFAACDVFAMMSREDPFPLVCLEAAALGKPIVCFDRSGGAREFVETDCGVVVPYLDISGMAEQVLILLQAPQLREQMGARAAQKVRERHDIAIAAPQVLQVIQRFL